MREFINIVRAGSFFSSPFARTFARRIIKGIFKISAGCIVVIPKFIHPLAPFTLFIILLGPKITKSKIPTEPKDKRSFIKGLLYIS